MSVVVRELSKRFAGGSFPAVSGASFEAPSGVITSVLGPSGAGKTTILRLIAGLEWPDSGTITVDDQDWTHRPVRKRRVGLVAQSYALFQHMTVRGNIAFGLEAERRSRREIDARVAELLALIQLEPLAKRYPGQLSGGQQQRVAFARALAIRPEVVLLDEPFAALDSQVRLELRQWLAELHARTKVTTLLVTHDQQEALELSDHVVLMQEGRVVQCGSPHEIYDRPSTPFVASFVGATNRLRGRVAGGRTAVGALSLDAPAGVAEGGSVDAFVRPHDVRIERPTQGAPSVELARIERSVRVGGHVKVEIRMPSGELLQVQMSIVELEALGVSAGDRVQVDVRAAKVFAGDYSI